MMVSRQRFALTAPGPPVVIGRDLDCDVVLNDPYVAARHAQLSLKEDGSLLVEDLGTVNGLIVREERVRHALIAGETAARLQVGHSHLRIRTAADPLVPERPDRESLRSRHREYAVTVLGGLLCTGFAGFMAWIAAPDELPNAFVRNLLGGAAVLAAWFGLWVFLGRAVRSRWQWPGNAAITLGAAALCLWLWWGTEVTIFVAGTSRYRLLGGGLVLLVAAVAIYLHVRTATRLGRARSAAVATLAPLLAGAAFLWFQQQSPADVNRITPPGQIFPPAWSRQPGVRLDRFIDESLDLRDVLDQQQADVPST
ncbi:MAG: FHA domain-containing protein [Gammaproteobacteria bacterium]